MFQRNASFHTLACVKLICIKITIIHSLRNAAVDKKIMLPKFPNVTRNPAKRTM